MQGLLLRAGCADITVRALVVVRGELEIEGPADPSGTLVVARGDLPRTVRALEPVLEPDRVAAVAHVARQRATWAR